MMTATEELELRLGELPEQYPDFVWLTMFSIKQTGLVDEVLQMLRETPDATTFSVTEFESEYCGQLEFVDDDGARVPVGPRRMRLTRGMREMLADLKGRTLKAYVCSPAGAGKSRSEEACRVELGSHAIDFETHASSVDLGGAVAELCPMRCERASLDDYFRAWSREPSRTYLVGERITGVELVCEQVELPPGLGAGELAVDAAVALRTAHGVYTFARASWTSTDFRIAAGGGIEMPYAEDECRTELVRLLGEGVGEVVRMVEALA